MHASEEHGEQQPTDLGFPYQHGEISDEITDQPNPSLFSLGRYMGADPGTNPNALNQGWTILPRASDSGGHHHDFMSYGQGPDTWTSDYTYKALCLSNLDGKFDTNFSKVSSLSSINLPPKSKCLNDPSLKTTDNLSSPAEQQLMPMLLIRGEVTTGVSAKIYPIVHFKGQLKNPNPELHASDFELQILDRFGKIIDRSPIEASSHTNGQTFPFAVEVADRSTALIIAVTNKNGKVIGQISRRKGMPLAKFITLPHGILDKSTLLTWETRHDDQQGKMTTSIEYSPDSGKSWQILALDLESKQFTIDPKLLAGGTNGRIRLLVNDGYNETVIDGLADLSVAKKPPHVFILEPIDNAQIQAGERVLFRANATSLQSGMLLDSSFLWFANGSQVGIGQAIEPQNLNPGTNSIELHVIDRFGLTTIEKRSILIDKGSIPAIGNNGENVIPSIGSK